MKRAISLLLSLCLAAALLACPAGAASTQQQNRADALNSLHLFLGTGTAKGYDLDSNLNRNQGVILLVRILGKEQETENGGFTHPFTDVPAGAAGAVAYAYSNHIVNGYTATAFGGSDTMSDTQFLALVLRALGYTDKGDAPDFAYAESRTFAQQLGLVTSAEHDAAFTRGDVVEVVWNALNTKLKGQEKTLAQQMMEQGVFTQTLFDSAADIAKNGKPSSGGSTSGGSSSGGSSSGGSTSGGSTSGGSTSGGSSETVKKPGDVTWEEYEAMSGAERQEHFQQFESPSDYLQWMNEAKAAYDKTHPTIEVGPGGNVDLSEIIKGNS